MHMIETLDILKDLIRIDTQNPPGDESALVAYIRDYCDRLGIKSSIYTYEGNRANIMIRMGRPSGRNLVVLGHSDVVTADPDLWSHDPFAAEVHDGYLYGRGALDMKYYIASALSAMKTLLPYQEKMTRQIIFLFTADEETGSSFGLPRVLKEPEVEQSLRGSIVLNEGGGFSLFHDGICHYLYETGQKSVCSLRASIPELPDTNPYFPTLEHEELMLETIERLQGLNLDESIPATIRALQEAFLAGQTPAEPEVEQLISTMGSSIITATILQSGSRNTALPKGVKATVDFDCRILPHITREEFEEKIRNAVNDLPVTLTVLRYAQGYEARVDESVTDLLLETLRRYDSEIADLLPFITPGSNDGKYLRPLGCDVVGFAPLAKEQSFTDIMPLIHGIDERISLDSIEFCTRVLTDVCIAYLTGEESRE